MRPIPPPLAFVGFGEAGRAFARALAGRARAYDVKLDAPETRPAMLAALAGCGVEAAADTGAAVAGAGLVVSVVTADQALAAAAAAARALAPGTLFCDFNSVAPETKRRAAALVAGAGGRYADVAVMAPVHPQGLGVPLLVSGPEAAAAVAMLAELGFRPRAVGARVGEASAIKMIRSVMIKGIEALSAECALAAHAAGVAAEVVASLDASWPGADWAGRFDYNLDRMLVHGLRRAAEMEEVVATLDALGTGAAMARATARRQAALGALGGVAPDGLAAKIDRIRRAERIAA